ncbi:MAG: archaeosortase/exosortase family protein, partial [Sphingomonas sp.]|uniref:archaeosortase/exosortase family protein n=1 Tax=Sphingomonas sp. TaxID=28214 RepID=UPI003F2A3C94
MSLRMRVQPGPLAVDGHAGPASGQAWRRQTAALGVVSVAILLLFATDVRALATLWWTSTTFGHCLFIAPVVAWLVWQRRAGLAEITPIAWAPGLALVALGGVGWLLGDAGGVALARHLGIV